MRRMTGRLAARAIEARAGGHVERLRVIISPSEIRRDLGKRNLPEQLARRRADPDPTGAGAVDVPCRIEFEPIGYSLPLAGEVDEHVAAAQGPVGSDGEDTNVKLLRVVDVGRPAVGREGEPVRPAE